MVLGLPCGVMEIVNTNIYPRDQPLVMIPTRFGLRVAGRGPDHLSTYNKTACLSTYYGNTVYRGNGDSPVNGKDKGGHVLGFLVII